MEVGKSGPGVTERFIKELYIIAEIGGGKKNNKILTQYLFSVLREKPKNFPILLVALQSILQGEDYKIVQNLAIKYLEVISFLCERFGLYEDKLILDDLCFKLTKPGEYARLSKILNKYKKESEKIIQSIFDIFNKKILDHNIRAELKGRYKNIFSIYKKTLKKKNLDVLTLGDIFAFRIVLTNDSDSECFDVLNILHNSFNPSPLRFKDYITIPKINGYQSIHTGLLEVIPELDLVVEVQIRTQRMHEVAESGVAAHYIYAREKKTSINNKEEKLFEHITTSDTLVEDLVYCLTPKGDIVVVNKGDNICEFASKIHSDFGLSVEKATINEKKEVGKEYILQQWDIVELILK